jgi:hypothetical protein
MVNLRPAPMMIEHTDSAIYIDGSACAFVDLPR